MTDRGGFTVAELLISIGVVGLLVALLLPSVQSAREAARRTQCASHLRQLVLAAHQYEAVHGRFPGSHPRIGPPDPSIGYLETHHVSPHALLLPYLDQVAIYESISFSETGSGATAEPPTSSVNADLFKESVPIFGCPSDSVLVGGANYRGCAGTSPGRHQAQLGPGRPKPPPSEVDDARAGVFFFSPLSAAAIRDGLSHTAFFSERIVGDAQPASYTPARDILNAERRPSRFYSPNEQASVCAGTDPSTSPHFSFSGATWVLSARYHTLYTHVLPPNSRIPDCAVGTSHGDVGTAAVTARSWHFGGVNVAFGDANVRMLSESVDTHVWRAIATIDGRESGHSF